MFVLRMLFYRHFPKIGLFGLKFLKKYTEPHIQMWILFPRPPTYSSRLRKITSASYLTNK